MVTYSKKIIEHFKNPKNVGKIKNPSGIGDAGNLLCGDLMKIYIKVEKNKKGEDIIKDIKFETLGCIVAIANSSLLTTLVKGKKIDEALKIKKEDLIKRLGQPLPPFKIHCSVLAIEALKEAIYDYYYKNKIKIPKELEEEHKRIVKIKKEIEKRYKKFREFEKKVLE
ncbi:MAG: iron-sulfur cluster assembly scaffold protein [Minisyncoccia bacterium]